MMSTPESVGEIAWMTPDAFLRTFSTCGTTRRLESHHSGNYGALRSLEEERNDAFIKWDASRARAVVFRRNDMPCQFEDKCGVCEYSAHCGGSPRQAFAYTGDPLASDPFCPYEPKAVALASNGD